MNYSYVDEMLIPSRCSKIGSACTEEELLQMDKLQTETWEEIVPITQLQPGYEETRKSHIPVTSEKVVTHIRLNYFPDGGVARFKVFGVVKIDPSRFKSKTVDLINLVNGGLCVGYSNAHYGHPQNLIKPSKGCNMADGWETARRLDRPNILTQNKHGILNNVPGYEWCIFRMGVKGTLGYIVIDTNHYKGNFADTVRIEGAISDDDSVCALETKWKTIVPDYKVKEVKCFEK